MQVLARKFPCSCLMNIHELIVVYRCVFEFTGEVGCFISTTLPHLLHYFAFVPFLDVNFPPL